MAVKSRVIFLLVPIVVLVMIVLLVTLAPKMTGGNSLAENATANAGCLNLAPGLERMAMGVDITKLDLFHDFTVDVDDGFTRRIIDYTCNEGKTWRSPYDSRTYQIPDQIDDFSALSAGMVIAEASIYYQKEDMKKEMSSEIGLGLDTSWLSFSSSLTYKSSFHSVQTLNKTCGSNKAHVTVTQATFAPAHSIGQSSLSKYLISELEDLPPVYNKGSEKEYFKMISSYGTHFFNRGHFGGSLTIWFAISKSLTSTMSSGELQRQVSASFLTLLKAHNAYTGRIDNVDERFTSESSHTERYFGGQANLFDSEGFKAWWSTIAGNPWLHSGSVVPVTDLLNDSNPRKKELLKAIQAYKLRASVHEMRILIQLYQSFHWKYADDVFLKKALHKLSNDNITVKELSAVDKEVQEYTITPAWFGTNFKLCMTAADNNEKYCTPLGRRPTTQSYRKLLDYYHLSWDVDGPLDPKLLEFVKSNTSFKMSTSVAGHPGVKYVYTAPVSIVYNVNNTTAPAWIKNTQFGVRYDSNGGLQWYLNDPLHQYSLAIDREERLAFFILPAPL